MIRRALPPVLIVLLVGSFVGPAVGGSLDDDLDEIRQSILALTAQLNDVEGERSVLAEELLAAQGKLDAVETQVAAVGAKLTRINREHEERSVALGDVRTELAERFGNLASIRADRDDALDDAKASVLQAYMRGGTSQPSIAFSASAVTEVSVGVAYLDVLTGHRSEASDRYAEAVAIHEAQEARVKILEAAMVAQVIELERTAAEIDATERKLELKRSELAAGYERQMGLLAEVEAQIGEFEGELTSLEREEASIRSRIQAASQPAGTRPGQLVRPIPGRVESGFGPRTHPIYGTVKMHNGVDMHGPAGQAIRAGAGGTVIQAGVKGGYGNTVMIDHGGGMVTLYAHQSSLAVSVGEKVTAGQTIGYVGSSGISTGPHLHFEVRIKGTPVDPMNYL